MCNAWQEGLLHHVHLLAALLRGQAWAMNLTRIREAKGLTQRALAEMIGMDAATVNRAEKMHHTAKLATYALCAQALDVTLADIFADDRSALEAELLAAFRRVPSSRHEELLAMIRLVRAEA